MSFSFPRAAAKANGYVPEQVDAFIAKAREQYSNPNGAVLESSDLRATEFDFVHGGYSIGAVDSALDRLEDSFANREIARQRANAGNEAVADHLARVVEIIRGRLSRPERKKFASTGFLLRGYSKKQVDQLCNQLSTHFESGQAIALDEVRRVIFKATRGGYVESQVDAFIDRVIEALHIERNS
ncbi:MAG: hypothetical protein RJB56_409 [Actinomycetota bacterium]